MIKKAVINSTASLRHLDASKSSRMGSGTISGTAKGMRDSEVVKSSLKQSTNKDTARRGGIKGLFRFSQKRKAADSSSDDSKAEQWDKVIFEMEQQESNLKNGMPLISQSQEYSEDYAAPQNLDGGRDEDDEPEESEQEDDEYDNQNKMLFDKTKQNRTVTWYQEEDERSVDPSEAEPVLGQRNKSFMVQPKEMNFKEEFFE